MAKVVTMPFSFLAPFRDCRLATAIFLASIEESSWPSESDAPAVVSTFAKDTEGVRISTKREGGDEAGEDEVEGWEWGTNH